ncbi:MULTISPECIES: DNA repair exonuclease [Rhizobium/Agrobacterium group]|uniref:DNA repair exonuclease n=2 Tax=Neorhizobium TaxID=1525371 RepID=A0ABV0M0Z5_9HYPH|nr:MULTISPECIES: DNA repair exonuclease [Rhizobium/Agrobacterium group]KGD99346.1 serine/threonine protein phosphatase [Rhizobium sp. YS-1r]MCC2609339.1 DNA repair exonuclease [Neorhizobium petrolearium]WGI69557.1 DNA repair exonuclease [Neorhizobium petrolearium]
MTFRFIHAADLHLGSPFQGLAMKDAAIAELFIEASRKAFSALVDQAVERRVDFFIVAGDVYDGDWKDNKIGLFFNREVARLERAGIPVFLLKGNHDAESVITKTITLPKNVSEFPVNKPGTFKLEHLKVALHGQGFAERSATENLALAYPKPEPGWFNVGVLHTSLTGREPHAPYAPCSVEDLRSRGYDYWALGHVHDFEIVAKDPLVVFPGNLQGRSIREQGAKGAVLVTVEDGRVTHERIITDSARFGELAATVEPDDDIPAILRRLENALESVAEKMEGRPLALRIRLTGRSRFRNELTARADDFRDEVQAACHRCHEDIWLEKLDVRLEPETAGATVPVDMLGLAGLIPMGTFPPELLADADARIAEITARLPGGIGAGDLALGDDAETLLAEARDLLLARAARAG